MNRKFLASGLSAVVLASIAIGLYLSSTPEKPAGEIAVSVAVDFGSSNESLKVVRMGNGTTAFDALDGAFNVEFSEFAGLGKMVIGIDGTKQNSTHHWFYYVNGKFAHVASDKYFLYENSNVLFRFTAEFLQGE